MRSFCHFIDFSGHFEENNGHFEHFFSIYMRGIGATMPKRRETASISHQPSPYVCYVEIVRMPANWSTSGKVLTTRVTEAGRVMRNAERAMHTKRKDVASDNKTFASPPLPTTSLIVVRKPLSLLCALGRSLPGQGRGPLR